jgi:hypothetical protein
MKGFFYCRKGFALLLELLAGITLSFFCFLLLAHWFENNRKLEAERKQIARIRDQLLLQSTLLEKGEHSNNRLLRYYQINEKIRVDIYEIPAGPGYEPLEYGIIIEDNTGDLCTQPSLKK